MEQNDLSVLVLQACDSWQGFGTLKKVFDAYHSLDVYIAGGIVRNILSGNGDPPNDFDIFIRGDETDQALADLASLGQLTYGQFGSPRWQPQRESGSYADIIPIDRFRNGLWICKDITDVLNQFDFTANAVAVDLRRLSVFDPQNGVRDAQAKILRAVRFDYPDERILPGSVLTRPFVLWCRLLHYAAVLDFHIEPVTLEWLRRQSQYVPQTPLFEKHFFPLHPGALSYLSAEAE